MSEFKHISAFHMGNGLSVCDTTKEKNGDYKKVAFIYPWRGVQFYGKVSYELRSHVFSIARTDNRNVSSTQEQKVFRIAPNEKFTFTKDGKDLYNPKVLSYSEDFGKRFLTGTIYFEDEALSKLNSEGFESYDAAKNAAELYGYELASSNYE